VRLRCRNCGIVQTPDQMREPADWTMRVEQKITVCWNCGSIYGEYVDGPSAWGEGVVLGDGKRYFRVRDLPPKHPLLDKELKHLSSPGTFYALVRDDPDMLVARA
jgi:hypothetical protein